MKKKYSVLLSIILALSFYSYDYLIKPIFLKNKTQIIQSSYPTNTDWNINDFPNYYQIIGKSEININDFPEAYSTPLSNYKKEETSKKEVFVSDIVYSNLDDLGRTGTAYGTITYDMVNISVGTREKWESNPEPSGWYIYKSKRNNVIITENEYNHLTSSYKKDYLVISNNKKESIKLSNGKLYRGYFYNRSHLIADSLGGRAFRENVVTATRTQNVGNNDKIGGMQYIEWKVMNYIKDNKDVLVYYKAEPIYEGKELLPRYVIVSALSSDGVINEKIKVFNSAEGFNINYFTGEYSSK